MIFNFFHMNNKNKACILVYALMICMFTISCKKEVAIADEDSYHKLYIPQAAKGVHSINFQYDETEADTVFYGAAIGGFTKNEQAIALSFEILNSRLTEFNLKNNTSYQLLPKISYTLVGEKSLIPQSKVSSGLSHVIIDPGQLDKEASYLLPIEVKAEGSGILYNEKLKTIFITVTFSEAPPVNYDDYSRSLWEVHDFSSHDPWEGGAEGNALSVLDDKPYTFWSSRWQGGQVPLPHHITVDMNEVKELHGITFMNRTYWDGLFNGPPTGVIIQVSNDGNVWEEVQTFTDIPGIAAGVEPAGIWNRLYLNKPKTARYFKFTVIAIQGSGSVTSVAELGAF